MTADLIPWPIPGDSELDKARRIAMDYRNELFRLAPAHCEELDAQARRLGQGWVTPQIAYVDLDSFLSARDMADLLGVAVTTVYQWASRGHLDRNRDRNGRTVYWVRQAVNYQADLRRARADRVARRSAS